MDAARVGQVRRFNRAVTQRIGALSEDYLARGRSLGQSRVLWEIGPEGCDLRLLRARLDLDSGYLSRLLRSLEDDGLVAVRPSPRDMRVRTARLTRRGRAERALLDRRSDRLAESLLAPLSDAQQARLVAAMEEVERLLTSASLRIDVVDPAQADARHCLHEYFAELDRRFESGFDAARSTLPSAEELRPPDGLFLLARLGGQPVGCGGLRLHHDHRAEIKRMWVAEPARGLGIGRRLLAELERHARLHSCRAVRLETNRALVEAIAMYRSAGYREVDAFNDELYAHHWFEKDLAATHG